MKLQLEDKIIQLTEKTQLCSKVQAHAMAQEQRVNDAQARVHDLLAEQTRFNQKSFDEEIQKRLEIEKAKLKAKQEQLKDEQKVDPVKMERVVQRIVTPTAPLLSNNFRSVAPNLRIDMELSDEYETMPEYFQKIIPKSHPKLREMMEFHRDIIELGTRMSKGPTEFQIERVIKNEMPMNPALKNTRRYKHKCKICHLQFYQLSNEVEHVRQVHNGLQVGVINDPYKKLMRDDNICILGCGFQGVGKRELRLHLIIMHSDLELTKWGFSRMFLKLQEGLIDIKTFREITSRILKEGKGDPLLARNGNMSRDSGVPINQSGRISMNLMAPARQTENIITL